MLVILNTVLRFKICYYGLTMTKTNETTRLILNDLYKRGIYAWRNSVGTGSGTYTDKEGNAKTRWYKMGKTGSSDILAVLPPNGRLLCIEIKTASDRLRPEQVGFKANIERMGAIYLVVKSFDDYLQLIHKILF